MIFDSRANCSLRPTTILAMISIRGAVSRGSRALSRGRIYVASWHLSTTLTMRSTMASDGEFCLQVCGAFGGFCSTSSRCFRTFSRSLSNFDPNSSPTTKKLSEYATTCSWRSPSARSEKKFLMKFARTSCMFGDS